MAEAMDGASRHVHRVWLRTRLVVEKVPGTYLMTGLVKPVISRILRISGLGS